MGEIAGGVYLTELAFENLAGAPSNPIVAQTYWDTTRGQLGAYDGTNWVYFNLATTGYKAQSAGAVNVTVDASTGSTQVVNLTASQGGNTTAITNPKTGQLLRLGFVQDGTGSRTYTWPTTCRFAANSAPAASTGANRGDFVEFVYNGAVWVETARSINVPTV